MTLPTDDDTDMIIKLMQNNPNIAKLYLGFISLFTIWLFYTYTVSLIN